MYPGDLELFELVPLCREFIDNSWERPRIYCDKEGMEYMQLEDQFTDLFSYIFDHTNEVHYKCFSDIQENDDGYYVLGYISVKIVNKFIRESVSMGTDRLKTFLSHSLVCCTRILCIFVKINV